MADITEQDRQEWAGNPVTKELLSQLVESRLSTMEAWASERFVGQSLEQGAMQNSAAIGGIRVLNDIIRQVEGYNISVEGEIE